MIKEKLFWSINKRREAKRAKKFAHTMLTMEFGRAYKLFEHNSRRRMEMKAAFQRSF